MDEIPAKGPRAPKAKGDPDEERPAEPEARAIDVKVKAAEDGEVPVAGNLDILKQMQDDKWETYDWVDAEVYIAYILFLYPCFSSMANHHHRPRTHGRPTKTT